MSGVTSAAGRSRAGAVVVTGRGAVSALGDGAAALWGGLAEGRDGFAAGRRLELPAGFTVRHGALVPAWNDPRHAPLAEVRDDFGLWSRFALPALHEAWSDAGLERQAPPPSRCALVVGTLRGHRDGRHDLATVLAAQARAQGLLLDGPRLGVATACASSAHALGLAFDLLRRGAADLVLAGGSDVVTLDMFAGFHALGLLAPSPCAPFSEPPGTSLGEGAGFLVLERAEGAAARGARLLVDFGGYGFSADAYHATTPEPGGRGIAGAVGAALAHGGLAAAAIGYVNAHGTGTTNNDAAEWQGLRRALGDGAATVPISSSKSAFGHAQGAAGILEAIVTVEALHHQAVPPTLHFTTPRPDGPPDPVADGGARPHRFAAALSVNAAFGGANAALLFQLPGAATVAAGCPVAVAGAAAIGPHGDDLAPLAEALLQGRPLPRRRPAVSLERFAPLADPRGLDPSGLLLTAAAGAALADGGIVLRGEERERSGLFVGANLLSPRSAEEYTRSLERRGPLRPSASAFTRIVLNAPAGAACLALDLRGPSTVVAAGGASGLVAIAHGATHLGDHPTTTRLLAGGLLELPASLDDPPTEGAALLLLDRRGGAVELAGSAVAGPGDLQGALAQLPELPVDLLFTVGDLDPGALPGRRRIDVAATLGPAGPASAAFAAAAAFALIRADAAASALIVAGAAEATAALLLVRRAVSVHGAWK